MHYPLILEETRQSLLGLAHYSHPWSTLSVTLVARLTIETYPSTKALYQTKENLRLAGPQHAFAVFLSIPGSPSGSTWPSSAVVATGTTQHKHFSKDDNTYFGHRRLEGDILSGTSTRDLEPRLYQNDTWLCS